MSMSRRPETFSHLVDQRFRLLVEAVTDYAIYMLDPDGRIATWNQGARRFKGYDDHEVIGTHFSRFFSAEDRAARLPSKALEAAATVGRFEGEGWRWRKDGSRFWAHVVIDPIRDPDGTLIGFAKITRDITERHEAEIARHRAEQELEEARAALFQSQKLQALGELTGGIAHDFNNLITVIRGSAELLQRPGVTPERRDRYLAAIIETADRAATLTDHLLAFGRRQPMRPEVLDLNLRLDAFADVIARTLGSDVRIELELVDDLWHVQVDPTHLETALLNAAINARDAMPDGGRLILRTSNVADQGPRMVQIAIVDTGCGMPRAVLDHAFEPFFTTKPVGKGTGLGLSQIHGFAAQAGGRAEIVSAEGEGTTLKLLLPASDLPCTPDDVPPPAPRLPQRLNVLVVEDNDQVRAYARCLLSELGCTVQEASDGAKALVLVERQRFDLVLSDVVMPGMSGIELARELGERRPGLPVLLATGYSEQMLQGAAVDFAAITKPYGYETLSRAIARLVGAR